MVWSGRWGVGGGGGGGVGGRGGGGGGGGSDPIHDKMFNKMKILFSSP